MNIILSPQRSGDTLTVSKSGDVLTINGSIYDFTLIPDGATLPSEAVECEWIIGDVSRVAGDIELTLLKPYIENTQENCFPEPIIDAQDGVIV